jgi:hypothetical protein
MAREAYPFQIDENGWDVCWESLKYLNESQDRWLRVYE